MAQFSPEKLDHQIHLLQQRTNRRWTIREIAKSTKISPSYLTFLKNGHRKNPSYEIITNLSAFFEIDTDHLLEFDDQTSHASSSSLKKNAVTLPVNSNQTLELCQQLLQSNNAEHVIQLLTLLEESGHDPPFTFYIEKELIKAAAFQQLGHYDKAEEILDRCLQMNLNDPYYSKTTLLRGQVKSSKGDVAHALSDFHDALLRAIQEENLELVHLLHHALGQGYQEIGEYGLSIYHMEQSLRTLSDNTPPLKQAYLFLELGQLHLQVKSFNTANQAFLRADQLNQELKDPKLLGDLPYWLAKVHFYQGRFEEAVELLQVSLHVRQSQRDHEGVATSQLDLAACYQRIRYWESAESCAKRAAVSFENMNEFGLQAKAKLLQVEAMHHLMADPAVLLSMINPLCEELDKLHQHFDLAVALRLKADLLQRIGQHEQALQTSMQALEIYHSCEKQLVLV